MAKQAWLRCTISPGQFSDEFAVSAIDHRGSGFSLFAPLGTLKLTREPTMEPVEGFIGVKILQEKGSLCLVRLPARTMENGDLITVDVKQIVVGLEPTLASHP